MDTKSCDTCLFTFQDTCNELKIPTVLMMGTALGICRDGTYCEGDYDLDVGVFCNKQKVLELFKKLKEKGLIQAECWQNQGWEINQHFWYSNNNEKVLLDIHIQYLKDEEKFFNSMNKVNYKDKTFNIPTPSKDYFNLNYGENWAIPQQGHGTRSRPLKEERIKVNGGPEKSTPMDILDWFNCKIERYEGEKIKLMNKSLRRRIITEGTKRKHGHYGSSMSCLDAVKHLYDNVLTDDDIFIMSKGHGAPALHVVLEEHGIIPRWTIHIEYDEDHGIKATGGSLGQGLSVALGRAYAKKLKGDKGNVYCLIGDGELQEGMTWECFNIAKGLGIDNLIPIIDWNKYQAISSIKEIMGEDDKTIRVKLEAFGYSVTQMNGHSLKGLKGLEYISEKGFQAIILDTQKGFGIPVLERNPSFHVYYFHEHQKEMQEALEYLK